jgi:hypothetical protein
MPQQVSVPRVLEGDFRGQEPAPRVVLSCSGNTRTTMLQINQPTPERMYSDADVVYYVIGGRRDDEALDGKESKLVAQRLHLDSARRLALVRAPRESHVDSAVGPRRRSLRRA